MDEKIDRSQFLKKGFFKAFKFFTDILGDIPTISYSPIRPPGAIEESKFIDTCLKCGNCIKSCEQKSIKFSSFEAGFLVGFPIVEPNNRPCFACDDLSCMKACPTGALNLVDKEKISMGTAIVDKEKCVTYSGHICDMCVKACPFPEIAIKIDSNNNPNVMKDFCIGCGLCQYQCEYNAISIKSYR